MKAIGILKEVQSGALKGTPDVGTPGVDYSAFVHIGDLPGAYACVVICGTGAQLLAIQNHANCVLGLQVTEAGVRWSELDVPVPAGIRTKINTYRQAQGQGNIPASTTLLQVVRVAANNFDWGTHDVFDGN